MKFIFLIAFSFVINTMYGQQDQPIMEPAIRTGDSVTVIGVFNKMKATKDGYYVGDYVVKINSKEAKQLDGKKIKITGVLNIIKGLNSEPPQYDDKGKLLMAQGREGDTKYIFAPVIKVLAE